MSSVEVQKALVTALAGIGITAVDAARQVADGGAISNFPTVEVGFITMTPFDTSRETGFTFVARVHVRHRTGSMKAVKDLQDQIYTRLHRGALAVTGFHTVDVMHEQSFCNQVEDGAFHGVSEYRGLIEKT
jgi:hypothetical protein